MEMTILMVLCVALGDILVSAQDCPPFGRIQYGRVKYKSRRRIARFRCRRKYILFGSRMALCLQGKWSHTAPFCIAPGCDDPDPVPNLVVTPTRKGALLSFECLAGYILEGATSAYCDGKIWNVPTPTCKFKEPALECSFETIDLCDWTQYNDDDFDWSINSGKTATDRTGPDTDHTYNTLEGHYLHIESSSPRMTDDVATLVSPSYSGLPNGTCFELYYHMKGSTDVNGVGTLNVYVRRGDENMENLVPCFTRQGHQSDDWIRGSMNIGDTDTTIQIVISAIRGTSYIGDISIDDVRLYNCSDDFEDITTESLTTIQPTQEPEMASTGSDDITTLFDLTTQEQSTIMTTDSIYMSSTMVTTIDTGEILTTIDLDTTTSVPGTYNASTVASSRDQDITTDSGITTTWMLDTSPSTVTRPSPPTEGNVSARTSEQTTTAEEVTTVAPLSTTATTVSTTPQSTTTTSPTTKSTETTTKTSTTTTPMKTTTETTASTTTTTEKRTTPYTTERTTMPPTSTTSITTSTTEMTTTMPSTTKPTTTPSTTKPTTTPSTTKPTTTKPTTTSSTTKPTTTKPTTTASTTKYTTTTPSTTTTYATTSTTEATTTTPSTTEKSTTATTTMTLTTYSMSTKVRTSTTTMSNDIPTGTRPVYNDTDIPNVVPVSHSARQTKDSVKPLMIGIGVGVAIGLAVVLVIVFVYIKKHRQKPEELEEMAPIARNAYSEW